MAWQFYLFFGLCMLVACSDESKAPLENADVEITEPAAQDSVPVMADSISPEKAPAVVETEISLADITTVAAAGQAGAYTFSVTVSSPDTGCQQYADWWEVLDEEGQLLYRRVLLHSHAGEQPFTRSGGPVEIAAEQIVWVRAHMNTKGYGGVAFKGSVQDGFAVEGLAADFAVELAEREPLPQGCAF